MRVCVCACVCVRVQVQLVNFLSFYFYSFNEIYENEIKILIDNLRTTIDR